MASQRNASGEVRKVHFDNIYSKEFSSNGKEAYMLRVTLMDGKPKVGFSRFWHNFKDNQWYPTKDHFFFPVNVWEKLIDFMPTGAMEISQLDLSGMQALFY
ncbi:MAG: hypothetical protein FD122_3722 [Stygiobacter sp.]|nr:MAG: hypothetical protein FD122_3722 [Stygiobacter sp.]